MPSLSAGYRFDRKWDLRISLLVGLAALLIGSVGVLRVVVFHDHGALGSYVPWGLWVSAYVYLVWMEVGMVLSYFMLRYVLRVDGIEKLGSLVILAAICALLAALVTIGMDLGHPFRAWRTFLFADFGSPMTWMIWLHSFYLVLLGVELWAYLQGRDELVKKLHWIGIPAGVALIFVIGSLFGVIGARPFWNAASLPMAFFVSSLVAGTALILILHLLFSPAAGGGHYKAIATELGEYLLWAILLGALGAGATLITMLYPGIPARVEAMNLILFGPYWWSIWIVHLVIGTLVPLALIYFYRDSIVALGTAAALLVVTFVMVPLNFVIPGLAYPAPELQRIADAYVDPRLSYAYFPDATEWLVVIFALGLALTLFAVGYRLLLEERYSNLARRIRGEDQPLEVGSVSPAGPAAGAAPLGESAPAS